MYNQPTTIGPDGKSRGVFYRNPIDCLWKTLRAEGVRGWYKGPIIPPCTADLMLTPDSTSRLNRSLPTDCSPYVRCTYSRLIFPQHSYVNGKQYYNWPLSGYQTPECGILNEYS